MKTSMLAGIVFLLSLGPIQDRYRVFAFEELPTRQYFDLEMLKRVQQFGTPVKVVRGTTARIQVKLIQP